MNKQKNKQRVHANLQTSTAKQLEEIAGLQDRTVSQQVSRYIRLGLEHDLKNTHQQAA